MERIVQTPEITIYQGEAKDWPGDEEIDIVLTNPYGYLPESLKLHPMVIHQWAHKRRDAEMWCYNELRHCVGLWNISREAFWSAHLPETTVNICDFRPEAAGWWPEEMVRRLVLTYVEKGQTVFDGFMGRGTLAKVCRELGVKYVGVERLPAHIAIALDYLEIAK